MRRSFQGAKLFQVLQVTTIKKRACQQIPQCTANCERDNHKPKVESLVLKPMSVNPDLILDLITVSDFSRSVILISQSGIFWSCGLSSSSPHPHEQSPLPETILSFLLLTTFLLHPVSAYKCIHTVQLLGLRYTWDAARFMNRSLKPIRSSHLLD